MPGSRSRRKSRIIAFQALFESDVTGRPVGEVLGRHLEQAGLARDARDFTHTLVGGVQEHRGEIDDLIRRYAPAYPLEDMAAVDRNVLRLAIYEVVFDNRRAPLRAAINEAIEIAKGYGSESSGRFVNGVLGAVAVAAAERRGSNNGGGPGSENNDDAS